MKFIEFAKSNFPSMRFNVEAFTLPMTSRILLASSAVVLRFVRRSMATTTKKIKFVSLDEVQAATKRNYVKRGAAQA